MWSREWHICIKFLDVNCWFANKTARIDLTWLMIENAIKIWDFERKYVATWEGINMDAVLAVDKQAADILI